MIHRDKQIFEREIEKSNTTTRLIHDMVIGERREINRSHQKFASKEAHFGRFMGGGRSVEVMVIKTDNFLGPD